MRESEVARRWCLKKGDHYRWFETSPSSPSVLVTEYHNLYDTNNDKVYTKEDARELYKELLSDGFRL